MLNPLPPGIEFPFTEALQEFLLIRQLFFDLGERGDIAHKGHDQGDLVGWIENRVSIQDHLFPDFGRLDNGLWHSCLDDVRIQNNIEFPFLHQFLDRSPNQVIPFQAGQLLIPPVHHEGLAQAIRDIDAVVENIHDAVPVVRKLPHGAPFFTGMAARGQHEWGLQGSTMTLASGKRLRTSFAASSRSQAPNSSLLPQIRMLPSGWLVR